VAAHYKEVTDRNLFAARSIGRCGTSWRICSRNGESADAELRRMDQNGGTRAAIWESRTKRVVIICRSLRKRTRGATFIVVQIAKKHFRASAEFAARSRVSPAAENITAGISIRAFG
jgi:hypothetical protein